MLDQKLTVTFQKGNGEKESAAWDKGSYILWHEVCFYPFSEGGMRCALASAALRVPPYAKK
jgi:hypothetical protein